MTDPVDAGAGPPLATVVGPSPRRAVRTDAAATSALALTALLGLFAFTWPLFVAPSSPAAGTTQAPFLFALLLVAVLILVLLQIASGGIDVQALAMLGVLAGAGSVLRALGAGVAGVQPMFFLVVLGGRVFGAGFGFVLGVLTMGASALLTGGVGPWLPFQMVASGFLGLGAGLLPRCSGTAERWLLVGYGAVASYLYGVLMNLSFWPFVVGTETALSYRPGAAVLENLHTFALFSLTTSAAFDLGRAATTAVLIALAGPAVLAVLRRGARRAHFD